MRASFFSNDIPNRSHNNIKSSNKSSRTFVLLDQPPSSQKPSPFQTTINNFTSLRSKSFKHPASVPLHKMPVTARRSTKPSLMTRLRAKTAPRHTTHTHHTTATTAPPRRTRRSHVTTTTTAAPPVHHHKRKTSVGDKVSGAMLKLKGSLTRRPGQKAAGTRRMRGTDGRGARRYY